MRATLHGARVDAHDAGVDHVATLTFAPGTLVASEVRFGVDDPTLVHGAPSLVPFVPAAIVLASRLGHDLQVDEPLPPALHHGARAVASQLAAWYGWRPAELIAPLGPDPSRPAWVPRHGGVGLFFTRGIDSWSTYLELRDGPRRHRPTHLILVATEVHHAPEIRVAHVERTRAVADRLGLPLVVVRTDIRAALDPHLDWGTDVHGSVFAGIGLLLRRALREVVISPTHWTPMLRPWGSHPALDPRWSLPDLRVIHHPGDAPRWQRVERVAADPVARRSIQVCWQGTSLQNCGRCEKCLRLQTSLSIIGALDDAADSFDVAFGPTAIVPTITVNPHTWCDTIDHLDHVGLAADPLRQRWEQVQRRGLPGFVYQGRPIQPRVAVRADDPDGAPARSLARRLAHLGARVDHEATKTGTPGALVISTTDPTTVAIEVHGVEIGRTEVDRLARHDLLPLLDALGRALDDLVPFDPDGEEPPPVVADHPASGDDPATGRQRER